ncbi:MAG: hypoxanthine phosphoribosyltransferase [Symbiobacteriaceae bacterium]|nr:hypoxanthine phosphoribosyltransferase [Symbiobacteriaceae bacterium]
MGRILLPELERVLLDESTIKQRVRELAEELSLDFKGKDVVLVGVLKGSFCFLADLARGMSIPLGIDFVACSSYGLESVSGGNLSITKDISGVVQGRELIIVEDIVDTGLTLRELTDFLSSKQPAGVHTVTLLDKPSRRRMIIDPDYVGFSIPDEFVVGYGLDYAERFRELPYIGVLRKEVYLR